MEWSVTIDPQDSGIEKKGRINRWAAFYCNGCGEPRYKCYCHEDCPFCDKKLKDCIGDSDSGYCPNDPNLEKLLALQKSINNKE